MAPSFITPKNGRSVLGRGLGALIPGAEQRRDLFYCPVEDIVPTDDQPRTLINPDSLQELSDSIHQSGVLQPILLKREGNHFRIICGERRWRAARMAGLKKVPALVKDVDEDEIFALALVENLQREDLTPIEEATAYRRLISEFSYTQKDLAQKVGKGRSTIANAMRLLDLPKPVRRHVALGRLTPGHARAVLSVPKDKQEKFADDLVAGKATVRRAEALARPQQPKKRQQSTKTAAPRLSERSANLRRLERLLRDALQTRIDIRDQNGVGCIEIHYNDEDTLDEVIDRLLCSDPTSPIG